MALLHEPLAHITVHRYLENVSHVPERNPLGFRVEI